ncbi:hypothetical protein KSP39_PZI022214 [Platanthera zijinensis]|uniref:Uncharacterized protein n=1 Tax=Platanthera zijinensis TaxID=2320716 RepID=A0AAP0AWP5_9ASPA
MILLKKSLFMHKICSIWHLQVGKACYILLSFILNLFFFYFFVVTLLGNIFSRRFPILPSFFFYDLFIVCFCKKIQYVILQK